MLTNIYQLSLIIVLLPLFGALVAGLFGKTIGRTATHWITILAVLSSSLLSMWVFKLLMFDGLEIINQTVYTWLVSGGLRLEVGFLIDTLTATMMVVVTFVSTMVHIYTVAYMHDDDGYQRFFSYISLFTFAMLMLVMSNNFMQLFFGWEAVGLVSYLLIGFWYKKPTAIFANLKAFLVNRVGDFGFLLGIAAVLMYFNSLDYVTVFNQVENFTDTKISVLPNSDWSLMTFICICLFIGAMGKSAQVPLHVWLPDSMEGPTPISALIHAATMVTAGIFMVTRMSPLFEYSDTALSFILYIGGTTALFMGFLGLVQNDIKRVVAYSTLSQLGYMTVALGASAYSMAIFHLVTHAFFKALLFLGAGAVIVVMHHEQDMRKMGGLYKSMPLTWVTCLIGSLALIGFPGTSGFFSKDAIIEAVHFSEVAGSTYAYYCVLIGVFFTALYSFRLFFMTFHGKEKMDKEIWMHLHEAPLAMVIPLCILAIPSLILGFFLIEPMLMGNYFADSIFVHSNHEAISQLQYHYHGVFSFITHAFQQAPLYLAFIGIIVAYLCYVKFPHWPKAVVQYCKPVHTILINKYGFDWFNQNVLVKSSLEFGNQLWRIGDVKLIDGVLVNGTASLVKRFSGVIRHIQSGYLYHYAFSMILGLLALLAIFIHGGGMLS